MKRIAGSFIGWSVMLLVLAGVVMASVPATEARGCRGIFVGPDPEDNVYALQAHGVSCSTATDVALASRRAGAPFDVQLNYNARGFHCHGQFVVPPGGAAGHIYFRCSRGSARITFDHQ